MIPRLQGEESLLEATRIGVGGGHLTPEDSKTIRADWHRDAGQKLAMALQRATKPTPADLDKIGIQVVRVPKGSA